MIATPRPSTAVPGSTFDYWIESRQPLASLFFILPLLAVYEFGVVALGPNAVRNGADVWLRGFLEMLDFGQYFLLPVLVIGILLGWHHTTRRTWRIPHGVFGGMTIECGLMAVGLLVVSQVEAWLLRSATGLIFFGGSVAAVARPSKSLAGMIGFLGAGVYEELLFRLMLLSAIAWIARRCGASARWAAVSAILVSSAVFAAAHYVGRYGEPIALGHFVFWYGLIFRFLAGAIFGILFVVRGFGIAAGSHAGYDILVRLL